MTGWNRKEKERQEAERALRNMAGSKPTNPKDPVGSKKVPIHYVPMGVMSEVGLGMLEGHVKGYGAHNYRAAGVRASVYVDAVWRHLFEEFWDEGKDIDDDSGLHQITKAICCLVVLRDGIMQGMWTDDRPIKSKMKIKDLNAKAEEIIARYPGEVKPYTALDPKGGKVK